MIADLLPTFNPESDLSLHACNCIYRRDLQCEDISHSNLWSQRLSFIIDSEKSSDPTWVHPCTPARPGVSHWAGKHHAAVADDQFQKIINEGLDDK